MQQIPIYFKSDFKLFIQTEAGFAVPFKFEFYTNMPSRPYIVKFDGHKYHNCELLEDGRLCIAFDDHGFGLGKLMIRQSYYLNDADYASEICDRVIAPQPVVNIDDNLLRSEIVLALSGDDTIEFTSQLPPYYQAGLTPEEHQALIDATVHAEEAAASANEQAGIATEAAKAADEARQALTTAYNEKVAALDADYAQKKSALEADYAGVKNALSSDYASVKAQLDADYAATKEALSTDYATALAGLNDRMTAIESQFSADREAWNQAVSSFITASQATFDGKLTDWQSQVDAAIADITRLQQKDEEQDQKLSELEEVVGMTSTKVPEFELGALSINAEGVVYTGGNNRCRFLQGEHVSLLKDEKISTDFSDKKIYIGYAFMYKGAYTYIYVGWKTSEWVAPVDCDVWIMTAYTDNRVLSEQDIETLANAFQVISDRKNRLDIIEYDITSIDARVTLLEQSIPSSPFEGKKIVGIGDSIMIGINPDGSGIVDGEGAMGMQINSTGGFLGALREKYPSVTILNMGIGGTTMAQSALVPANSNGCILDRIDNIPDGYDYIVLEGGINDYFHKDKIDFGSYDAHKKYYPYYAKYENGAYSNLTMGMYFGGGGEDNIFDLTKFSDAVEIAITKVITRFKDKKYMYLLPHCTNGDAVQNTYMDTIVEICKKYGMPCLDMRERSGMPRIAALAATASASYEHAFTVDAVHPNRDGYRLRYLPAFESFLNTL